MKTACILVIRCGAGCASATALGGTLQSVVEGRYEVRELILSGSVGDQKNDAIALAIQRENPRILLFCPCGDRTSGQVSRFLELGRRKSWDVPVMAVLERQQPDELLAIMKLGVSDFITLPLP